MPFVVGANALEEKIRTLMPKVHVCGHSHINFDKQIMEIRYVQNALGHPDERRAIWRRLTEYPFHPKLIYSKKLASNESISKL